jgi:dihydroxyacetone kinase-like protein
MQKLYNDPACMVNESIAGFVKCYQDEVAHTGCDRTLKFKAAPVAGKVGIVSGGGSGHDPAFMGYIGKNMLDAVAIGNIFTPPSIESFYTAFKEADAGQGVVCLIGNYPKDIANVRAAIELAKNDGISVKMVIVNEDVAISDTKLRRGMTGEVLLWKIAGAAASLGYSLDDVLEVSKKALCRLRSIGIGLASCIMPESGRPNYVIELGTMEIGVGHHGFSSMDTCKLKSANATADIMVDEIIKDMPLVDGDSVAVMISGLGNTMLSEINILFSRVYDVLAERRIGIHHSFIGNYFTSLDMMGVTLTMMSLDDELTRLLDIPAYPVALNDFAYSNHND